MVAVDEGEDAAEAEVVDAGPWRCSCNHNGGGETIRSTAGRRVRKPDPRRGPTAAQFKKKAGGHGGTGEREGETGGNGNPRAVRLRLVCSYSQGGLRTRWPAPVAVALRRGEKQRGGGSSAGGKGEGRLPPAYRFAQNGLGSE